MGVKLNRRDFLKESAKIGVSALNIVDATEFIITNGPMGPGKIIKPQKVVAGVDRIAIDSYCCTLWELKADEIYMIKAGFAHGLGQMDLSKVSFREVDV